MPTPIFQIDAFTDQPFTGNPAAVCVLQREADVGWMQNVAAEMKLSETAFVRPLEDGWELRWFTPAVEVQLCGHATLASACVLWAAGLVERGSEIRFHTRYSGVLTAGRNGELIELDFPAIAIEPCEAPAGMLEALGVQPVYIGKTVFDRFLVVESAEVVRGLRPDFRALEKVRTQGVIVTAESDDERFDFISRFFAPAVGVEEDPCTGSAHCCLGPYWGERLGKRQMVGYQASQRGGTVHVGLRDDRVTLGGQAVIVLKGELV